MELTWKSSKPFGLTTLPISSNRARVIASVNACSATLDMIASKVPVAEGQWPAHVDDLVVDLGVRGACGFDGVVRKISPDYLEAFTTETCGVVSGTATEFENRPRRRLS